ncbi:hypothetical protein [Halobellus limi]|jgi:hypothetical protein|uniref:DUF2238 domain-containing protein n=1 Tax=Halobellus limi TaxID=699433 RepID=A0A1H5U8B9_9EURY|nr:hypothetical protein [Halobellus limi]QCC47131.1 hypothetical protein DV707_05290 [Halobellus limi]SEF70517.1 hypothetical protein SAMN04488133_0493 [Halobellus limi]
MRVRDLLHISERRQRQAARGMQLFLASMLVAGLLLRNVGVIVNASIGLVVTFLPGILERDLDIPIDAGLALWISAAVFLHAVGTITIPGVGKPYANIWWWDHLTHALSASLVAGVGYATTRAVDIHSDAVSLPPRFQFVFILLFVLAFGVLWEVIEFTIGLAAEHTGTPGVLTQYGLGDSMLDLVFDTVGAIVVAVYGSSQLGEVVDALTDRLAETRP